MVKKLESLTNENSALYLRKGYKKEDLRISVDEIGDGIITGVLDVKHPFRQPDGSCHLPSLDAYIFVSQLAIAYGCHYFGKTKEELGQFVEHEQWKKSSRAIEKTEGIVATLSNIQLRQRGNLILGSFDYDIEHGSVLGWVRGVMDASHPEKFIALRDQKREEMFNRVMAIATAFYITVGIPIYMTPGFCEAWGKLTHVFIT